VGVGEGGKWEKEWVEEFYEKVLLPCNENLREGLAGHFGDGLVVGTADSGMPHNWELG